MKLTIPNMTKGKICVKDVNGTPVIYHIKSNGKMLDRVKFVEHWKQMKKEIRKHVLLLCFVAMIII